MIRSNRARPASADNRAMMMSVGVPAPDQDKPVGPLDHLTDPVEINRAEVVSTDGPPPTPTPAEPAPTPEPAPQPEPATKAAPVESDEIEDERFKGKSKRDVYKSYKELESKLGEQSQQVGQFRKFFDEFVLKNMSSQPPAQPAQPGPATSDDEDEAALLNEMLGKPKSFMQRLEQRIFGKLNNIASQHTMAQTRAQVSDLMQDPKFQDWVRTNVPQQLAQEADRDPALFQFVINSYRNQTPPAAAQPAPAPQPTRVVPVGAAAVSGGASKPQTTAKVWKRSEIMDVFTNKPDLYWSPQFQSELAAAYRDKRVK